jgi:hypothetical protein
LGEGGRHITASPDLNTLFPASANLFATMANKINERGQISGMAIVLRGPDAGNIHAFLATPVNGSMGISVADVAPIFDFRPWMAWDGTFVPPRDCGNYRFPL